MKNVCLHLNRPKKVSWGNFCTLKVLLDSFVRIGPISTYWAEIEKVNKFATIRTYWAEVLKDPQLAEIRLPSACFESVNYFSTLNSSSRVTFGYFSKNVVFDQTKNFIGVQYNLVDFWSENVSLYPNRPNKVIYGYLCTFMALWDSFVRIGPRYKKWTYLPLFVRIGQRY